MKKLLIAAYVFTIVFFLTGSVAATTYYNVGEWGWGPLEPQFQSWNPDFVKEDYYRIAQINWTITNNTSYTYTDVTMVLPFVWDSGTPNQAYEWVDADNQWIITDQGNGFDGLENGCYAELPTAAYTPSPNPPTETYMLMSDTDLPTSYSLSGYETASVLSTDSVPAWEVTSSLAPSESIDFSIYIQIERGSGIGSFYIQPYMVSTIPEPATICMFGLGGLVLLRKKRVKSK